MRFEITFIYIYIYIYIYYKIILFLNNVKFRKKIMLMTSLKLIRDYI